MALKTQAPFLDSILEYKIVWDSMVYPNKDLPQFWILIVLPKPLDGRIQEVDPP